MVVLSTMRRTKDEILALNRAKAELGVPPPIDFYTFETKREKKGEKSDSEMERDEYRTFEVRLSKEEGQEDTYEVKIRTFRFGKPEEWCVLCDSVMGLAMKKQPTIAENAPDAERRDNLAKTAIEIFSATLDGKAGIIFEASLRKYIEKDPRERLRWALNEVAVTVFSSPDDAYKTQKRYLTKGRLKMFGNKPQFFWRRLETLNNWLPFFPRRKQGNGQLSQNPVLPENLLIEILDEARHPEIQHMMLAAKATCEMHDTADAYASELDTWWDMWQLQQALKKAENNEVPDTDRKRKSENSGQSKGKKHPRKKCKNCGGYHKAPEDECWSLEKNKQGKGSGAAAKNHNQKRKERFNQAVQKKAAEMTSNVLRKLKDKKKADKCKVVEIDDSSGDEYDAYAIKMLQTMQGEDNEVSPETPSEINTTIENTNKNVSAQSKCRTNRSAENKDISERSDNLSSEKTLETYAFHENSRPVKQIKSKHYTAEIIVQIENRHGKMVPARCLLDTGTTESIVLRDFVRKGRAKGYKGKTTKWKTMGGVFETNQKALIEFSFPELSGDKRITWICHVDGQTKPDMAMYDMILGMDLLTEIGLVVDTEQKVVRWEDSTTPLKQKGILNESNMLLQLYHASPGISTVHDAETRQARILDADYSKIDIEEHVNDLGHLTEDEKQKLIEVLIKCDQLFGGGLGTLKIPPVHLELQKGATPFHARAFPVPQALYETTKKEIQRLTTIGVFEKNHESEWAAPTFVQPKKTGDVRILTDFRRLNTAH